MTLLQLPIRHVRQYNAAKQHIMPGFQAESIIDVARNLVGIHSARLSTPYVALHGRLNDFQTRDLRNRVFVIRDLLRLRCMRRTLHTLPLDIAPIAHQATLSSRISNCLTMYRRLGVSSSSVRVLQEKILEFVEHQPFSSAEIQTAVREVARQLIGSQSSATTLNQFVRTIIKQLWEEGSLCYINVSNHWGAEQRLYGSTSRLYPGLNLNAVTPNEAQEVLIYMHVDRFGPVTEADISWWSGLGKAVVRRCLADLRHRLITVNIEGFDQIFYMTAEDQERFSNFQAFEMPWLRLLAYEDPWLKGYFESRSRYVNPKHYDLLFNQIGEARPSIVVDGEVVGIWSWDKRANHITCTNFKQLDECMRRALDDVVEKLEMCLSTDQVQQRLAY